MSLIAGTNQHHDSHSRAYKPHVSHSWDQSTSTSYNITPVIAMKRPIIMTPATAKRINTMSVKSGNQSIPRQSQQEPIKPYQSNLGLINTTALKAVSNEHCRGSTIYWKIPPPPQGGEYQPMSFGGKNMKREREKRENKKGKGRKGKDK